MKTFLFKMYTRTNNGQEFVVGQRSITAKDVDDALKIFNRLDLPFHTFSTVE